MKEIVATLRPERWQATREALGEQGIYEALQHRVLGRGRQRGLRYLRPNTNGVVGGMDFLSKRMAVWIVADEVVSTIVQANAGGNYGDGKIFVCPLGEESSVS